MQKSRGQRRGSRENVSGRVAGYFHFTDEDTGSHIHSGSKAFQPR